MSIEFYIPIAVISLLSFTVYTHIHIILELANVKRSEGTRKPRVSFFRMQFAKPMREDNETCKELEIG